MKKTLLYCVLLYPLCLACQVGHAQVTTAAFKGKVTDTKGEGLPGANVVAVHEPTGTKYGLSTRTDGGYTLPNLRIGGPYTITATFVGYQARKVEGVFLKLGQTLAMSFALPDEATQLGEVEVVADNDVFDSDRTGAATNIDNEQLKILPTISRSATDIYRLNPASDGNSFGGRNDQFNNFSLDGTIFNNPFGLDAATPGGQTSAQPISLDAIDQIQVSIAPYDVTQAGFTGAAINAVTKSGTNEFHGTLFGFYRNDNMTGSKVSGRDIVVPDLRQLQTGFSVGGPIVKDKLFFFANFEMERREDLGSNFIARRNNTTGENVSRVEASDLEAVSNVLRDRFGYETGPFEDYIHDTENQKGIIKLDWNINTNHTLTATYNFLDAFQQKPAHPSALGRRGPDQTTLQFFNSGYRINNVIHSGLLELNSRFGNKFSNKLQVGLTAFRDSRDPFSEPFPVININRDGIRYIIAGHEPFSINNSLDQDVFQFTNNFDIYAGDHTVTVGTSFERFSFDNSFNLNAYTGTFGPGFASTQAFVDSVQNGALDGAVATARRTFEEGNWNLAETTVGQWALYAQDRWVVSPKLTLTVGVRMDLPLYFDTEDNIIPNRSDEPANYFDENGNPIILDNTKLPDQVPLISPRLGFNYDIKGDMSRQLRGGTGLFTGRFPFVWVGNQVANPFTGFLNITEPDFKFPQVWRTNLGYDHQFAGGWIASADFVYTKDINAMMVRNYALQAPRGTLQGVDNRPIYRFDEDVATFEGPFGTAFANAYVFTNTDVGRSVNLTLELKRNWANGLYTSLAYNYLDAQDASSIEAEISSDAYERNPSIGNTNMAQLAPSLYGNQHRVVGTINKRFSYGNDGRTATTVSMFFEYARGGRFSYTYSGDINGDNSGLNDLIYIPTDGQIDEMLFDESEGVPASDQRAALKAYIAQDDYLSERRGEYAEKYDLLSPWFSRWDFRLLQDFGIGKDNTVQLSLDILNVGNFISSDWGVRQLPNNTQPIGVSVADGVPTYSFDPNLAETFTDDFSLLSRWQMQVGLRYIF